MQAYLNFEIKNIKIKGQSLCFCFDIQVNRSARKKQTMWLCYVLTCLLAPHPTNSSPHNATIPAETNTNIPKKKKKKPYGYSSIFSLYIDPLEKNRYTQKVRDSS